MKKRNVNLTLNEITIDYVASNGFDLDYIVRVENEVFGIGAGAYEYDYRERYISKYALFYCAMMTHKQRKRTV
jgi:hypothetical protein